MTSVISQALASLAFICASSSCVRGEPPEPRNGHEGAAARGVAAGPGDVQGLVRLAEEIRDRTARGDLTSGEALFDEILGLDLKTSVLRYGKPPSELARTLGGLGELEAARAVLEENVRKTRSIVGGDNDPMLKGTRALARLLLAQEATAEAIPLLEEIAATRDRLHDPAAAREARRELALGRAQAASLGTRRRRRGAPQLPGAFEPPDSRLLVALSIGGPATQIATSNRQMIHPTFDSMIRMPNIAAAFEKVEAYHASFVSGVSLLTRLRGARDAGQEKRSANPELEAIDAQIQAVTRALDRIETGDPRYQSLRAERQRFQAWRLAILDRDGWDAAVDAAYRPTTVDEVRNGLDSGTALLSYFVAADHIDLLVLAAGGALSFHRLEVDEAELVRHLATVVPGRFEDPQRGAHPLRESSAEAARVKARESARWLFSTLVAPAEREIAAAERLLVVPDGPLVRLPFGALIRRGEGAAETYLVEWKPVHLVHSAAAYLALLERRGGDPRRGKSLVALGDPVYEPPSAGLEGQRPRPAPIAVRLAKERGMLDGLARLPGTAREVTEIGKLFVANGAPARVLLGPRASEAALKESAIATYVHLAAHGFVDAEQPDHSFLALSLPATLREDDENGILEAWEVVDDLRLDAELVTLSACETARGPEESGREGEGTMSLARAFQVAGARSVVASLWQIDDAATSQLMISFYRHLLAGSSKDVALQAAQLELLRSPELASPYYWAAFQLNGDWR